MAAGMSSHTCSTSNVSPSNIIQYGCRLDRGIQSITYYAVFELVELKDFILQQVGAFYSKILTSDTAQ